MIYNALHFTLKLFSFSSINGLIREIRLTSKFMTSPPGQQIITIHIMPNMSQSKSNQTMNFGQVIEYNKGNIFLQKLCRKWDRYSSSRLFCFFKKTLYEVKTSGLLLSFNYLDLDIQTKQTVVNFRFVIQRYAQFWFFT